MTPEQVMMAFHDSRLKNRAMTAARVWLMTNPAHPMTVAIYGIEHTTQVVSPITSPYDKEVFTALCRCHAIVEAAQAICVTTEAWVSRVLAEPDEPIADVISRAGRPSRDPERIEALLTMYAWRDPDGTIHTSGAMVRIVRTPSGRIIGFPAIAGRDDAGIESPDPVSLARRILPEVAPSEDQRAEFRTVLADMHKMTGGPPDEIARNRRH